MALHGSLNVPARGYAQVGLPQHISGSECRRQARMPPGRPHTHSISCDGSLRAGVKLPVTHISSSSKALQQLALSSGVNSASLRTLLELHISLCCSASSASVAVTPILAEATLPTVPHEVRHFKA